MSSQNDAKAEAYPVDEAPATAKSSLSDKSKPQVANDSSCRQLNMQWVTTELDHLNLQPTLWAGFPLFGFFCGAAYFLETYVVSSATAHLVLFLVGSYVVFSAYFVLHFYLSRHSSSYARIADDKKFYVLSNLIKSAVLLSYSPLAADVLYAIFTRDEWSTSRIRNLGVLYAIPDFVSLFLVRRMALTTKLHHICVVVFMVVNLYNDYAIENVARALVVYAVFSTFAYLVNLLLASRFLKLSVGLSLCMSAAALGVYIGCLALNWGWQILFLFRLWSSKPSFSILAYCILMSVVVYDDIVLVKWLHSNVRRKWHEASTGQGADSKQASMPTKCQ
jgi:hypothetical protein